MKANIPLISFTRTWLLHWEQLIFVTYNYKDGKDWKLANIFKFILDWYIIQKYHNNNNKIEMDSFSW